MGIFDKMFQKDGDNKSQPSTKKKKGGFYDLKVSDVRVETPQAVSIALEIPAALKNEFSFKSGQYVTFKLVVNNEEIRRSYSICSGPNDNELRIAVKRVEGGRGSNFLNEKVKAGDILEVMPPMGSFVYKGSGQGNIMYLAGGSGVTPMLSLIKDHLHRYNGLKQRLIYANFDKKSTIFYDQISQLTAENENLATSWLFQEGGEGLWSGIMSKDKCLEILDSIDNLDSFDAFFICGPTPLMDNAKAALTEKGIEESKIKIEYFTPIANENKPEAVATVEGEHKVTVILDGDEHVLDINDNTPILDVGLEEGLDLPYACKGAVCCTCKAKVIEGEVTMDMNYALTDGEVEEGYILTCQAHPKTPNVTVDYDVS